MTSGETVVCGECEEQLPIPDGMSWPLVLHDHWPVCPAMPRSHP